MNLFTYIIITVSMLLSVFFSSMEIAFVSSNKLRVKIDTHSQGFLAQILSLFYRDPRQFISTLLVGNTIVLVAFGIAIAHLLEAPLSAAISNKSVVKILIIIIATLTIIFTGEILPKVILGINSNRLLRFFSPLIFVFYIILYPIARLLTFLSVGMLRFIGVPVDVKSERMVFSKFDLNSFVDQTINNNSDEQNEVENEVKIFQNALDFSSVRLRECIVPRTEIIGFDIDTVTLDELKKAFVETGYSKILIYRDNLDNIIGYYHSSDLFIAHDNWKKCIRSLPIVPENMPASDLMQTFMQEKKSIAVIVDEFGGTAGIVTLEDIIEEIFGEIEDEHDNKAYILKKINDNEYVLSGRLEIDFVNQQLELDLPENADEYVTVAGLILHYYQKFPKLNDTISIKNWDFKVIQADNNRIKTVRLIVKKP